MSDVLDMLVGSLIVLGGAFGLVLCIVLFEALDLWLDDRRRMRGMRPADWMQLHLLDTTDSAGKRNKWHR